MTTTATSILGDLGSQYQLPTSTKKANKELGQDEFLMLMLTQFKNQDPLKPQDPTEFLSQLAQVSSVAGICGGGVTESWTSAPVTPAVSPGR